MKFISGVIKVLELRNKEKTFSRQSENKQTNKNLLSFLENNDLKVDKFYFRNKGGQKERNKNFKGLKE